MSPNDPDSFLGHHLERTLVVVARVRHQATRCDDKKTRKRALRQIDKVNVALIELRRRAMSPDGEIGDRRALLRDVVVLEDLLVTILRHTHLEDWEVDRKAIKKARKRIERVHLATGPE